MTSNWISLSSAIKLPQMDRTLGMQRAHERLFRRLSEAFEGLRMGGAGFSIKIVRPAEVPKALEGPNVMFEP